MFLVFGQFFNQTNQTWQWQQIGGVCTSEHDADSYAEGFAINYGMTTKVVGRHETRMYLPPQRLGEQPLQWPEIRADMVIQPH